MNFNQGRLGRPFKCVGSILARPIFLKTTLLSYGCIKI